MIHMIFLFLLLCASLYAGVVLSEDPGYLLIVFRQWTLETTLTIALTSLLILFIVLHGLMMLYHQSVRLPSLYQQWKMKRRALKSQNTTQQGLIEFSEGYWSAAQKHLIQALPDAETPLLNYLTAARAAQEMGDAKLRDNYLREAQQSMPDATIAVELTQAQLQLANHQWEQALATLRHLQGLAPHHPYVLKLLIHLYQEVRDWPQLIVLLPELKKYEVIDHPTFDNLQRHTYLQAMQDLVRLSQEDALTHMVSKLPRALKYDPDLMACYAEFLISTQQIELAESILHRCLRKAFHSKLIILYGQFYHDNKQLEFAESLLKKHPDSAALYLCLGRLSMKNNLWGKARNYLEKSLVLENNPAASFALGMLFEQFGDQASACQAYKEGLGHLTQCGLLKVGSE